MCRRGGCHASFALWLSESQSLAGKSADGFGG